MAFSGLALAILIALMALQALASQEGISAAIAGQRNIYAPYRLSSDGMVQFGQRPELVPGAKILQTSRDHDSQNRRVNSYLFSIELERGQTLRALPEEFSVSQMLPVPQKESYSDKAANIPHNFEGPVVDLESVLNKQQRQMAQQQQVGDASKFSRLVKIVNPDRADITKAELDIISPVPQELELYKDVFSVLQSDHGGAIYKHSTMTDDGIVDHMLMHFG